MSFLVDRLILSVVYIILQQVANSQFYMQTWLDDFLPQNEISML